MTGPRHGVSVVIPCLNEEASIGQVVDQAFDGLARLGLPGEVIVVDNGCRDRTAEVAAAHGARVVREEEPGYGAALRRGFSEARFDLLVMGDGDLSYDFRRMDELVRPLLAGEAEFVVGNRMRHLQRGAMPPLHRYVGNPLLSGLLRLMFHKHVVRDAHCGLRAITRDAYRRLRCVTTGMEFASEMIVRAIHAGVRMTERDVTYAPRVGVSKLQSWRDGWRHLRFMLLHSPSTLLLVPGLVGWFLGMAVAMPLAFGPVVVRGRNIDVHCMIMAGLLNVVSLQFLTIGLLAKAYAHLTGLRNDPLIAWLYRRFNFERFMVLTFPLIAAGLWVTVRVVLRWMGTGFGPLNESRLLFLGMLWLVNGTQAASAGYLFSIMALPRHVDPFPHERDDDGSPAEDGPAQEEPAAVSPSGSRPSLDGRPRERF